VTFWDRPTDGLCFSPARRLAANRAISVVVPTAGALAEGQVYWAVDLERPEAKTRSATHRHVIGRAGTLHGIAGWFRAQLSPDVSVDTAPGRPTLVWRQGFLPLDQALPVQAGDALDLTLTCTQEEAGVTFSWSGTLLRRDGSVAGAFSQGEFLAELWPLDVRGMAAGR
jgi:hypothetical protein